MNAKDIIRLWSKAPIGADGCWEWTAGRFDTGYGAFWLDRQLRGAHRAAYESLYGPIPDGAWVLHHCDNPPCVNPAHLHLGTPAVNSQEREDRGHGVKPRPPKSHCPQGHELSGDNLRVQGGRRRCIICQRKKNREFWRRQHGQGIKYRAH